MPRMQFKTSLKEVNLYVATAALAIGVAIGTFASPLFYKQAALRDVHEFKNTYHFINPLLACAEDTSTLADDEAKRLESLMKEAIQRHTQNGDITNASVYLRTLDGGPWVGIDIEKPFSPGSLLKVPLAISIYKKAETNPAFLRQQIDYTGQEVLDPQFFKPAVFPAGKHSVEELVQQMLINSDNNAAHLLAEALGVQDFEKTYEHLGVQKPPSQGSDYTTTTRDYSSFFRVLYNATYLGHASSENLLKVLSESPFTNGLVAGVPPGIVVSHKFGERSLENSRSLQLHDCGIVYAPARPYLICVMTQGTDFKLMAKTISELSRLAYDHAT